MSVRNILTAGDSAPLFTLQDANGNQVSLSDYAGKSVILYFYPAASTPGCTKQACDFRDNIASLGASGYEVIGISKDSPAKVKKFVTAKELNFPLLCDESLEVHKAYGAYGEKMMYGKLLTGTIRSTFVIDENGKITLPLYNVKATGHVAQVKKKLGLSD